MYPMITAETELSGTVVECLTRDRGVVGLSVTDGTALCPCKTH